MILIATFCIALLIWVSLIGAKGGRRLGFIPVLVGWLGLAAGFAWIYFGDVRQVSAWIGVSLFGTYAGLSPTIRNGAIQRVVYVYASVLVAAVSVVGLVVLKPDVTGEFGFAQVLICAQWTALFAAAGNWMAASGLVHKTRAPVVFLVALFAAVGSIVVGFGRSSLRNGGYHFRIRTGDDPLQFVLEPMRGLETGIALDVGLHSAGTLYALVGMCVAILVAVVAAFVRGRTSAAESGAIGFFVGGSFLGMLPLSETVSSVPDLAAYKDAVQQTLLARKLPGTLAEDAILNGQTDLTIAFADMAPEVFTGVFVLIVGLGSVILPKRDEPSESNYRRDFVVRGLVWLWLAWLVSCVFHGVMYGTPGLLSASEWMFTGGVIFCTGLVFSVWKPTGKIADVWAELSPAVALGVLVLIAMVSYRFGAPLGLSMTVLR